MDYRYLLAAIVLCTILLLALIASLLLRYRSWMKSSAKKDRDIMQQTGRILELEQEVRDLSELYKQSSESCIKRTEFYSNITHELKTPLSVILGAIQLIERKKLLPGGEDEVTARNLEIIRHNCYRMLRLINNLLDLTKLEAGYLQLKPVFCRLGDLLEDIVNSVSPYAVQKQLTLQFVKQDEPVDTAVDMEKLERILLNLLSNSIKYTNPGGTITVSVFEKNRRACISVKDTGVGISTGMQKEIFDRYKQTGEHPVLEKEGFGIGLSLVKSFVELHKGNIQIISEKDRGSEFIIDLPILSLHDEMEAIIGSSVTEASVGSGNGGGTGPDAGSLRLKETVKIEFSDLHPIAS